MASHFAKWPAILQNGQQAGYFAKWPAILQNGRLRKLSITYTYVCGMMAVLVGAY